MQILILSGLAYAGIHKRFLIVIEIANINTLLNPKIKTDNNFADLIFDAVVDNIFVRFYENSIKRLS